MSGPVGVIWPPHDQRVPGSMIDSPIQTVWSWKRVLKWNGVLPQNVLGRKKKSFLNLLHYVLFAIFKLRNHIALHFRLNHHCRTEQFIHANHCQSGEWMVWRNKNWPARRSENTTSASEEIMKQPSSVTLQGCPVYNRMDLEN